MRPQDWASRVADFESQKRAWEQERAVLEQERAVLEQERAALEKERAELLERNRQLSEKQRALEHLVALFKKAFFGSRSEKIDPKKLEERIAKAAAEAKAEVAQEKGPSDPPAEAEEEQPEPPPAAPMTPPAEGEEKKPDSQRKARPHGRGPFPKHLKRRRVEHPIPEAQTCCAHCPDRPPLICIGEDTCEKLVKIPAQYEVEVHVYPQMACQRCHTGVVSAPTQDNRLKADISVVADVVVKKYADHLPLYRQQQGFARLDIPMTRQTLCDWTGWCSDQVEPVVKAMADFIRRQKLIQSDETPVRMQLPKGQMHTARIWAYGLPWAEIVFDFRTDKSQTGPKEFLQDNEAEFIQADGGSSYGPVLSQLDLEHIACMAHIRRKFFEARDDAPLAVDLILAAIQKLYRIERAAKEKAISLAERLQRRQQEAKPIFEHLGKLIEALAEQPEALPKSPLGSALRYAQNQWSAMARYLEVAEAEIDNNSIYAARSINGIMPTPRLCRVAEPDFSFSA